MDAKMTLTHLEKTPWPWFGGKADAASLVWEALGDVEHYVEPFAGSLAVLLRRPHPCNRTYFSETVNDMDGLLCNAWRSIQLSPDETAEAASYPVCEADLHARHLAIVRWRETHELEHLMGDPTFHDPVMAGWWIWGCSCWIGGGWCDGTGAWIADEHGRLVRQTNQKTGVSRTLPHMGDDGQGVNRPQAREPGVSRTLPHMGNNGQGVNHPGAREPGVESDQEYHPMTMPEVRRWFAFLSARLRHVRILNGDWSRATTGAVTKTISVRSGKGFAGVFLDPPYSTEVRSGGLYAEESGTVAHDVRAWCVVNGNDPNLRIVLAGFNTEHVDLEALGWRCVPWFKKGFLKGGMAQQGANGTAQKRERLWLSPHCLRGLRIKPQSLFL